MENPDVFNRFEVLAVRRFQTPSIRKLMIEMKHSSSNEIFGCHLFGSWYSSKVFRGDIINVKSDDFDGQIFYIDDAHGLVIINPDILIPVSSVSKSRECMRREWLGRLFDGRPQKSDVHSTMGLVVRDIFQTAFGVRASTLTQLREIREQCLEKEDIASLISINGLNREMLIKEVDQYLKSISIWMEKYVLQSGQLDDGTLIQVDGVEDIEESVWCPSLGLAGKVNMSCEVKIHHGTLHRKLVPITLKTSKWSGKFRFENEARSKLYSMMINERNSIDCDEGLLLSLKNAHGEPEPVLDLVKVDHDTQRDLLQRRNSLAHYLSPKNESFSGPNFRRLSYEDSYCKRCPQLFNCSLMAQSFEQDKIRESSRRELIDQTLSSLGPEGIKFFTKWMRLIKDTVKTNNFPFWCEHSSLREEKNLGIGNLVIDVLQISERKIILKKACGPEKKFSNQQGLLNKRVALSEDEPCFNMQAKLPLFLGYVTEVRENTIEVVVGENVKNPAKSIKYRLDVVNFKDLPSHYNYHLSELMSKTCSQDLRHLDDGMMDLSVNNIGHRSSMERCNIDENRESELCFAESSLDNMNTYRLADGISDKTIDNIGQFISKTEKFILVVSHEPSTLNRVISTLRKYRIDFVCFGIQLNCDLSVGGNTIEEKIGKEKEINQTVKVKSIYRKMRVAVTTCSAISDYPRLLAKNFDLSIILEANKIPLPHILSPLFMSDRFILIDDESHKPSDAPAVENVLLEKLFILLWMKSGKNLESQSSSSSLDKTI